VGLLPLCAATVFEPGTLKDHPKIAEMVELFRKRHPQVFQKMVRAEDFEKGGYGGRKLASVVDKEKLRRILGYMLDENEFFSPYGIRSLSKYHRDHPFVFYLEGREYRVDYLPAESNTGMFGGNSNWRGPIWMPVNGLIIRGLLQMFPFYGPDFNVECPTGSGKYMTLFEVAKEIARRLSSMFLRDANGNRPVYGGTKKFQDDPYWKDYILFYEYFHGDNGAGLGASHQTGWTGTIARVLDLFARITPEATLHGAQKYMAEMTREQVAGDSVRTVA
jgi:mannosylglycerate hydrolase MGH1-like protein